MNGLDQPMRLTGYVPLTEAGFALPVYGLATEDGGVGNAPYVAIPEIEGDRQGPIAGFDILNVENMGVQWLTPPEARISVGDAWQDVFLWNDRVIMGTARSVFDTVAPWHQELERDLPLTYLDLALGAEAETTARAAQSARAFLGDRLGTRGGERSYRNIVIRPGVLLELHRHVHNTSEDKALPDSVRAFAVEPSGADRFDVKLPPGSVSRLGGQEAFSRLIEAIAEFGRRIGANLQTQEGSEAAEAGLRPPPVEPEADDPPLVARPVAAKGVAVREMAIDFGTAHTRIFVGGRGIVLREPSVVAIKNISGARKVLGVGNEALRLESENPDKIELVHLLRDGAIVDVDLTKQLIAHFIQIVGGRRRFLSRLDVIICVPAGSTWVERRALLDAVLNAGANKVSLIEDAMAAAIGADMPVNSPIGTMVVDIGRGKTEVAVISTGGIAYSVSIRTGGEKMDELIATYIRRHYNIAISESAAERIKKQFGRAQPPVDAGGKVSDGISVLIKGTNLATGEVGDATITQRQIAEAIREAVDAILDGVRIALENTAPELSADIVDEGIVLTGGGALLEGMAEALHDETGLPVTIADEPLECVAKGIGAVLENPDLSGVLI